MKQSPKPRRAMLSMAYFGRHYPAFEFIERHVRETRPTHVTAWVVGIGGISRAGAGVGSFDATEHLEMEAALRRAGIDKRMVHVVDNSQEVVDKAKRQIRAESVPVELLGAVLYNYTPRQFSNLKQYAQKMGVEGSIAMGDKVHLPLHPEARNKIIFHDPDTTGNIFIPRKTLADIVTCFNVAPYYEADDQRKMAEILSKGLRKGGVLITIAHPDSGPFLKALEERLGTPHIIQPQLPEHAGPLHAYVRD